MSHRKSSPLDPLTIFTARKIITMDSSLPEATAVAVSGGRIVAVGDLASMEPWLKGRKVVRDDRFAAHVLMPGFIDNHIHPFLGAILTPTEIIAPEPWRMPGGDILPAANSPAEYRARLLQRLSERHDADWFISFGVQPAEHGRMTRAELDELAPGRPVILLHRSFHESYLNTAALEALGLTQETVGDHPQVNLGEGRFYETGNMLVTGRLMPRLMRDTWYHRGLGITTELMTQGGVTTAADMLFGAISPDFELAALKAVVEDRELPLRIVNVCDARAFSNRAVSAKAGPPDAAIDFEAGLEAIEAMLSRQSSRIRFLRATKLFADGAMFSALMQMNEPGYLDGHEGEWVMAPDILMRGVQVFWEAGYQIHVHVNGDRGMDSVLNALSAAQAARPRFDHRFMMHHVGFHTNAQSVRMAALGAHASMNPYYVHALSDTYAHHHLGPERASQLTRAGSVVREGMRVSFHSDFMMAPTEPLFLAWCASARITRSGQIVSPTERLTLDQALRGVTIDAAFALGLDHEIGSIVAGKSADFAVLEDDPHALGGEHLKDVRVAGVVFEGRPHMLPKPMASVWAGMRYRTASREIREGFLPPAACGCDASTDPCAQVQRLGLSLRNAAPMETERLSA